MRRFSPVVIVGTVLTVLSLVLYISGSDFIQAISNFAYDALIKTVAVEQKSNKVLIVDIDEKSLQETGQWPWSRYLVADLTKRIFDDGASVIAFDIVFAEKDRTSPSVMQSSLNKYFKEDLNFQGIPDTLKDFDQLLAKVLQDRNVILGSFMLSKDTEATDADLSIDPHYRSFINCRGTTNPYKHLMSASGMTISIPELNEVSYTAFFNAVADADNIVRSNPLIYGFAESRIYPSLALEAVRLYRNTPQCMVKFDRNGVTSIDLRDLSIPADNAGRLVINYRKAKRNERTGFYSSFPTIPAADILSGKFDKNVFKDKIVFIGTSAIGLHDMKATPVCSDYPGVEVHATMSDNIIAGDMLSRPSWMIAVDSFTILITGFFLTIFISKGKSWLCFLVSIVMILTSLKISQVLLAKYYIVFVPIWIIISIVLIYLVLTMIRFWQEEMQKRKVRNMFGTMVSEKVLHFMENNPESFSLTGRRVNATIMFADVAGFTTISENLEPDRLTELLNRYLSPMTNIIMDRTGYVDKYEGDLIMAEWGVPYVTEDHAIQACLAVLEQQKKLDEIRPDLLKEFGHEIHTRTGLNTGTVVAGNMGSDKKQQYTVMGDAVNLAARFEPANKDYGSKIIIGENTYQQAKDHIEARLLDKLVVKGKTQPINIYELLAKKGELNYAKSQVIRQYEVALKLHWDRKWDESIKSFSDILELDPNDIPSAIMIARVREYKENPPPDHWNGEYVRSTKD